MENSSGCPGRSKQNEFGKYVRGVEVDWIEVQSGNFAPLTITRKEFSLGFPSDYTLPCLPTSTVKHTVKGAGIHEMVYFSFNGTSKICSRTGEQLAGENWDHH